ncbi:hypothetical protein TREMEDRAFT_33729 [Tremella mesenterica DSM 1558]|nr:uncharacterized protein TREMEDRAFT_33729 [Tremella mesenterica DSM 1558]EIW67349.1 hypothetical protein TREMEDRAFT_33729 [Tremella mesenterica DSM 1558]
MIKSCRLELKRIVSLLQAQEGEIKDIKHLIRGRKNDSLFTLIEIYSKVEKGIRDAARMKDTSARESLNTLILVLQEGPDYLIDIILIESIIFQAEIIDPSFGAQMRQVLDKAIAKQSDLTTFRKATESIIAILLSLPKAQIDDSLSHSALKYIEGLVKQLQLRVSSSRPSSVFPSPSISPVSPLSPVSPVSPLSPISETHEKLNGMSLQEKFGTGPISSPSGPTPQVQTANKVEGKGKGKEEEDSDSDSSSEEEQEIWEFEGNRYTRSALDLVLRYRSLALADSSGQYNGEVSWDDLREAWIPNWAEKLKVGDVAEGVIPDLNPANYQIKDHDAWGNKILWGDTGV